MLNTDSLHCMPMKCASGKEKRALIHFAWTKCIYVCVLNEFSTDETVLFFRCCETVKWQNGIVNRVFYCCISPFEREYAKKENDNIVAFLVDAITLYILIAIKTWNFQQFIFYANETPAEWRSIAYLAIQCFHPGFLDFQQFKIICNSCKVVNFSILLRTIFFDAVCYLTQMLYLV